VNRSSAGHESLKGSINTPLARHGGKKRTVAACQKTGEGVIEARGEQRFYLSHNIRVGTYRSLIAWQSKKARSPTRFVPGEKRRGLLSLPGKKGSSSITVLDITLHTMARAGEGEKGPSKTSKGGPHPETPSERKERLFHWRERVRLNGW